MVVFLVARYSSELHPLKMATSTSLVYPSGNVTDCKISQSLKTSFPTSCNRLLFVPLTSVPWLQRSTSRNFIQPWKTESPIFLTLQGILKLASCVQPIKAFLPIPVRGQFKLREIFCNWIQSLNAPSAIQLRPFSSEMLVTPAPLKAYFPMPLNSGPTDSVTILAWPLNTPSSSLVTSWILPSASTYWSPIYVTTAFSILW